jgi:hypothetical protein
MALGRLPPFVLCYSIRACSNLQYQEYHWHALRGEDIPQPLMSGRIWRHLSTATVLPPQTIATVTRQTRVRARSRADSSSCPGAPARK